MISGKSATTVTTVEKQSGRSFLLFLRSIPLHLALFAIAVFWLIPTLGPLVTSFRESKDIYSSGWWQAFAQWRFTLDNYARILGSHGTAGSLVRNLLNSFAITIPSTILPLIIACFAAYGFAWTRFWGRDWIFIVIVALMIVPQQMTFVPVLRMLNPLHLVGSFAGIWIVHTAFALPLPIFLLRNAFVSLPRDLIEHARIDGASEITIATNIVMPLSVSAMASYAIFQFLWVWNDLLVALVYLQHPRLQPLTVGITQMMAVARLNWDLLSAAAFLTMSVPLIVFFCLQRYFVRGLIAGAIKA